MFKSQHLSIKSPQFSLKSCDCMNGQDGIKRELNIRPNMSEFTTAISVNLKDQSMKYEATQNHSISYYLLLVQLINTKWLRDLFMQGEDEVGSVYVCAILCCTVMGMGTRKLMAP